MKRTILIATAVLLCIPQLALAQNVEIEAFYPAPYGTYDRIRLVPRVDAGINTNPCQSGLMYTSSSQNNELIFCGDLDSDGDFEDGIWMDMPEHWEHNTATNEVYLVDSDTVDTFRVGIGEPTPEAALEVSANGTGDPLFMASTDDDANGDAFIVMGDGRVGINNNNPPDDLTIDGGGSAVLQRNSSENGSTGDSFVRLTEENFRGGYAEYRQSGSQFILGTHSANNRNLGADIDALKVERSGGNVGDVEFFEDTNVTGNVDITGNLAVDGGRVDVGSSAGLSSPEALNVRGNINLIDNGTNWAPLAVEYSNGSYYMTFAP